MDIETIDSMYSGMRPALRTSVADLKKSPDVTYIFQFNAGGDFNCPVNSSAKRVFTASENVLGGHTGGSAKEWMHHFKHAAVEDFRPVTEKKISDGYLVTIGAQELHA